MGRAKRERAGADGGRRRHQAEAAQQHPPQEVEHDGAAAGDQAVQREKNIERSAQRFVRSWLLATRLRQRSSDGCAGGAASDR